MSPLFRARPARDLVRTDRLVVIPVPGQRRRRGPDTKPLPVIAPAPRTRRPARTTPLDTAGEILALRVEAHLRSGRPDGALAQRLGLSAAAVTAQLRPLRKARTAYERSDDDVDACERATSLGTKSGCTAAELCDEHYRPLQRWFDARDHTVRQLLAAGARITRR